MNNLNEIEIEERHHSLTVPGDMYHLQPEVTAGKVSQVESSSREQQDMLKEQARELGSAFLSFDNVSGEAIKPLSTPTVKGSKEKERKGRS